MSCNRLCEVKDEWMKYDVIGIDEGQFFSDIVEFSDNAADLNKIVVISALNNDYRRDAWPNIASLIPKSENVRNLQSICKLCGTDASFSFKNLMH